MKNQLEYRLVELSDAKEILEVYAPYIKNTTITFEYEVVSIDEFTERIKNISSEFPYIVCIYEGNIIGYAYAHKYGERAAYQWSSELSIYLKHGYEKMGVGKTLYKMVMDILKLQNIRNVYGCITGDNEKSVNFHKKLGFEFVGRFEKAGYKFDKWIDVVWYQKRIKETNNSPEHFIPINKIDKNSIEQILKDKIYTKNK